MFKFFLLLLSIIKINSSCPFLFRSFFCYFLFTFQDRKCSDILWFLDFNVNGCIKGKWLAKKQKHTHTQATKHAETWDETAYFLCEPISVYVEFAQRFRCFYVVSLVAVLCGAVSIIIDENTGMPEFSFMKSMVFCSIRLEFVNGIMNGTRVSMYCRYIGFRTNEHKHTYKNTLIFMVNLLALVRLMAFLLSINSSTHWIWDSSNKLIWVYACVYAYTFVCVCVWVFLKIKLIIIKFSSISKVHLFSWKHQCWHISFCVCESKRRGKKKQRKIVLVRFGLVWFSLDVRCLLPCLLTAHTLAKKTPIQMAWVAHRRKKNNSIYFLILVAVFLQSPCASVVFVLVCRATVRIHLQSICAVCLLFATAISICSFQPLNK